MIQRPHRAPQTFWRRIVRKRIMNSETEKAQLQEPVMLYCRGCDRRDFALVRSLYHDNAIDDHGDTCRNWLV